MLWEFPGCPVVRDALFQLPWPRVQSLVGELRSQKPRGTTKNKKKQTKKDITETNSLTVLCKQMQ